MEKLPPKITTNILSRLPVKSSVQCRCVCKPWCEILTDSKFLSIQLSKLSTISPDIFLYSNVPEMLYLDDSKEEFGKKPIKPLKEFNQNFIHNSFYKNDSILLGMCNGLICLSQFSCKYNLPIPSNPICIFNPITETYSMLPDYIDPIFEIPLGLKKKCVCDLKQYKYGFGFEDSRQEFKFVLVTFFPHDMEYKNEVQICTLGSSTWRRMTSAAPDELIRAKPERSRAFVNQCLHWVTEDLVTICGPMIVSFNLAVEVFDFVPVPPSHEFLHSKLGVLEGHLSAVEYSGKNCIQIWIMKKYNVKESWVKQFSIKLDVVCCDDDYLFSGVQTLKIRRNGELLLLCNGKDLLSYNITTQKVVFYKLGGDKKRKSVNFLGEPFVGSLISLSSDCGRDYQRDLKKRRK